VTRFGRGSVSLRLYPHNDLAAPAIVDERAQAALAADHGFDGVMRDRPARRRHARSAPQSARVSAAR